jgi:hypothetical protein
MTAICADLHTGEKTKTRMRPVTLARTPASFCPEKHRANIRAFLVFTPESQGQVKSKNRSHLNNQRGAQVGQKLGATGVSGAPHTAPLFDKKRRKPNDDAG